MVRFLMTVALCVFSLAGCGNQVDALSPAGKDAVIERDGQVRLLGFDADLPHLDSLVGQGSADMGLSRVDANGVSTDIEGGDREVTDSGLGQMDASDGDSTSSDGPSSVACGACEPGTICRPTLDRCVPDCRVEQMACSARLSICDLATGFCVGITELDGATGQGHLDSGVVLADAKIERAADMSDIGGSSCDPCPRQMVCDDHVNRCVPDCRIGEVPCPRRRPRCEAETGICQPVDAGACDDLCGRGTVCDPNLGECVRDCRSIIGRCGPDEPLCNPETGLCQGR